jgi:hypothetical protein
MAMVLQIWGVVLFAILWLILGGLGFFTYLVIRRLELGAREGKYLHGL